MQNKQVKKPTNNEILVGLQAQGSCNTHAIGRLRLDVEGCVKRLKQEKCHHNYQLFVHKCPLSMWPTVLHTVIKYSCYRCGKNFEKSTTELSHKEKKAFKILGVTIDAD